jgi:hypothetical protein
VNDSQRDLYLNSEITDDIKPFIEKVFDAFGLTKEERIAILEMPSSFELERQLRQEVIDILDHHARFMERMIAGSVSYG